MDEKQRYEAGMQVRRAVLGDAHVDRSLSNISEFNAEFQEMITRHAWGDIWTRPGLPRHTDRTRRLQLPQLRLTKRRSLPALQGAHRRAFRPF